MSNIDIHQTFSRVPRAAQASYNGFMTYRTVLVHVDDSPCAAARIRVAAGLARAAGGHLVGAALTGFSRFLYQGAPAEEADTTLALHLGFLRARAQSALAAFEREAAAAGLASCEARLIDDEAGAGIALHARCADLVVVGQADPALAALAGFPAHVVLHSGRPVLVLPYAGAPTAGSAQLGRSVLVAWDASTEAARALLLALPLLRQAAAVKIAVFDHASGARASAAAAAADPLPWLARHGIEAGLSVHTLDGKRGRHDVGEALLSLATDVSADLLVMGAYGHSRMRETILGGVTRTVFESMTIPVLMAH